jgi:2-keto-4-pentenoate hydratase/2-oxohepta-3-ene-1,7-dioic acid hydratase in catechol pathway
MKLLRYGPKGAEKPALLDAEGRIRSLSAHVDDLGGETVSLGVIERLRSVDVESLPVVRGEQRIGPCVSHVPTFYCVGLNYSKHAAESGAEPPAEPILFNKSGTSLAGPDDPLVRPKNSVKLDYEVELGVVIGRRCEHVSEAEALSCVAGYCVINDVSEREWQIEKLGQWTKGKSAPGFGPTGPWLVTTDEIPDPQALRCWLKVDGQTRQDSNTADMIFSVAEIVSYMSRFMALAPGDVIATGTPEGVAMGMKPQAWLEPGQKIALGIDGLGEQNQTVVDFPG